MIPAIWGMLDRLDGNASTVITGRFVQRHSVIACIELHSDQPGSQAAGSRDLVAGASYLLLMGPTPVSSLSVKLPA